jgi:hypothetical protein
LLTTGIVIATFNRRVGAAYVPFGDVAGFVRFSTGGVHAPCVR